MIPLLSSTSLAPASLLWARRLAAVSVAGMLIVLMSSGCAHEIRGKSRTASRHDESDEEDEDEVVEPGNVRRRMHKTVKEPDPWNLNKFLKDERTAEIERNLGIE